jgi:hypothetical protein
MDNYERELQFGAITLTANGFDAELYKRMFEPSNISDVLDHPGNWGAANLQSILNCTDTPLLDLDEARKRLITRSAFEHLTKEEIDKRHALLLEEQLRLDKSIGYAKSQGLFTDLHNASAYCASQSRTGINPISGRVHSDLFIRGEGSAIMISNRGIEYPLTATLWYEGYKHAAEEALYLRWPFDEADRQGRVELRDYMCQRTWGDGFKAVFSKLGDIDVCNIENPELDVSAYLWGYKWPDMPLSSPINGILKNCESFCQRFINQLDDYFALKR